MVALTVNTLFNSRNEGGTVKRGTRITDWLQYGLYYGDPQYLQVHDFSNWTIVVFDRTAGQVGHEAYFDPTPYNNTPMFLLYLPFGSEFRRAAIQGGYEAPAYNSAKIEEYKTNIKAEIDTYMDDVGYNGIFWDECDVGYWDTGYTLEGATIMREVLDELCDHVASKTINGDPGINIANGAPFFSPASEIFLLESFIGSYSGNAFAPNWRYNPFFGLTSIPLSEGEASGIPWNTGLFAYLFTWKYAYELGSKNTVMYGHSYGDPLSPFQEERQTQCFTAFKATGLKSVNYIDPANQHMLKLFMHNLYLGAPLETPQFDFENKTITRRFTGGTVVYNDVNPENSTLTLRQTEPEYWAESNLDFSEVPWDDVETTTFTCVNASIDYTPDYIKAIGLKMYDDKDTIYMRFLFNDSLDLTDANPIFIWMELDAVDPGKSQFVDVDGFVYLEFKTVKAQLYLYSNGLFKFTGVDLDDDNWQFLYEIPYEKDTITTTNTGTLTFDPSTNKVSSSNVNFINTAATPGGSITFSGMDNSENNITATCKEVAANYVILDLRLDPNDPVLVAETKAGATVSTTKDINYYALRKESLRFIAPNWDNETIKIVAGYGGTTGVSFLVPTADDLGKNDITVTLQGSGQVTNDGSVGLPTVNSSLWFPAIVTSGDSLTMDGWLSSENNGEFTVDSVDGNEVTLEDPGFTLAYETKSIVDFSYVVEGEGSTTQVKNHLQYTCRLMDVYVPHNAVMYSGSSSSGNKISTVTITGTWDEAWVFDRQTGKFIGSDGTPDTPFTSSPINVAAVKDVDATDIYVLVSYDGSTPDGDAFAVSAVDVTLTSWGGSHTAAYDVAPPDLIDYNTPISEWQDQFSDGTQTITFEPLGISRGLLDFERDSLNGDFTLTIQANDDLISALQTTDIRGTTIVYRRTYEDANFNDADEVETVLVATVDKWEYIDNVLYVTCKHTTIDWEAAFPSRQASYFCPYVFKDSRCKYEGSGTFCAKTMTACKAYGNERNFGGIVTIPRLQRGKWQ